MDYRIEECLEELKRLGCGIERKDGKVLVSLPKEEGRVWPRKEVDSRRTVSPRELVVPNFEVGRRLVGLG